MVDYNQTIIKQGHFKLIILTFLVAFSYAALSECVIAASNLGFQAMQLVDFNSLKTIHHWDYVNSDHLKLS